MSKSANGQTLTALAPAEAALYERVMENRDDLILLDEASLTKEGIAAELSARYKRGEMYTSIGEVLIAGPCLRRPFGALAVSRAGPEAGAPEERPKDREKEAPGRVAGSDPFWGRS